MATNTPADTRKSTSLPATSTRRKVFLVIGLLFVSIAAIPAYFNARFYLALEKGRTLLQNGEPAKAVVPLESAVSMRAENAEAHFLLARAFRRSGDLRQVDAELDAAARCGWPQEDIDLQKLMKEVQLIDLKNAEPKLAEIISDQHRILPDDVAEEVYECLARAFMSSWRMKEAMDCLSNWIAFRQTSSLPRLMRADIYTRAEQGKLAADEYAEVLKFDPGCHEARWKRAYLLLSQNRVEEALAEFNICRNALPNDPEVLHGVATCLYRMGKLDEADKLLGELLALELTDNQTVAVLLSKSKVAQQRRQNDSAVQMLERALKRAPNDPVVHFSLAVLYSQLGDREKAAYHTEQNRVIKERTTRIVELTSALVGKPNSPDMRCEVGELMVAQGMQEAGARWIASALEFDPEHVRSHQALATYYDAKGDRVKSDMHRKVVLSLERPEIRFEMALLSLRQRDYERVRSLAVSLASQRGYEQYAHILEGALLMANKRLNDALVELDKAKNFQETRPFALTFSGECLYQLKRYVDAEDALKQAIESDPAGLDARRWLASVYYDIGAFRLALEQLQIIGDADTQDPRPQRLSGLIYKDFSQFKESEQAYLEALKRNPNLPDKQDVLRELAEVQIELKKFPDALATLDKAIPLAPIVAMQANCYFSQTDLAKATELVESALRLDPQDPDALMLKSNIAQTANHPEEAADALKVLVTHHPANHAAWLKLSQVYQRLGERELSDQAMARSQQIRGIGEELTKLSEQAMNEPYNAELRVQIGQLSEQMDMKLVAKGWYEAALGIDPNHAAAKNALEKLTASLQ